jgi:hypothetical protein
MRRRFDASSSPSASVPARIGLANDRTPARMCDKRISLEDAIMVNRLCRNVLMGFGLLMSALSMPAYAQPSPKTVTLVVPFAAGGDMLRSAKLVESSGDQGKRSKVRRLAMR